MLLLKLLHCVQEHSKLDMGLLIQIGLWRTVRLGSTLLGRDGVREMDSYYGLFIHLFHYLFSPLSMVGKLVL